MNIKKRIMSILLATSILLGTSACDHKDEEQKQEPSVTGPEAILPTKDGSTPNVEDPTKEAEYVTKFREEIDSVKPQYKLLDHYLSDDIVEEIKAQEDAETPCTFAMEDFDAAIDDVVAKIRESTLDSTSRPNIYDGYADFKEDYFDGKYDFTYFIKLCLTDVLSHSTNDIREDLCTLSKWDIVLSDENPYDHADGRTNYPAKRIVVYMKKVVDFIKEQVSLEEGTANKKERFQELLYARIYMILSHEIDHARQSKCDHRKTEDDIWLRNYANHIKSSTIIESSAESALYNLNIDPQSSEKTYLDYAYIDLRQDESLLLLMGMTNSSIDGYYNGIFDTKFSEMYDFFHLETKEELESFYHILYSIDSVNGRTNLQDEITYDGKESGLEYQVGNAYLIDIFKISLKNMMEYTLSHPDFTIEENTAMFEILKNKMSLRARLFDSEAIRFCYGEDFIAQFDALIESYETFLKEHYKDANAEYYIVCGSDISLECINENVLGISGITEYSVEDQSKADAFLKKFPVVRSIIYTEYLSPDLYDNIYFFDSMREKNGFPEVEEEGMSYVYTSEIS